jgi:hypothetical protein
MFDTHINFIRQQYQLVKNQSFWSWPSPDSSCNKAQSVLIQNESINAYDADAIIFATPNRKENRNQLT